MARTKNMRTSGAHARACLKMIQDIRAAQAKINAKKKLRDEHDLAMETLRQELHHDERALASLWADFNKMIADPTK